MEKSEKQMIEQLLNRIPEKKKELEDVLAYGEKMKAKWEKLKQEFRANYGREDFLKLLEWFNERQEEHREYLDKMSKLEKKRFIKEYLHDNILYSGEIQSKDERGNKYNYDDLIRWNIIMGKNIDLDFWGRSIWTELLNFISKIDFKEWVRLNLACSHIGRMWAAILAENINLKKWMILWLSACSLWPLKSEQNERKLLRKKWN